MTQEWAYELFISYAEADKGWVEGYLIFELEKAEIRCISESAFDLGKPRINEFERVIRQSQYTLLVISQAYLANYLTQFTDILAQSYGEQSGTWPVIPLTLQEGLQLPPRLKMLHGLKATTSAQWEDALKSLFRQLQRPLPQPSPPPACPYPGMSPFSEKDEQRFFGRDDEIENLLGRLRSHPFLAAIGPSGSGKSSLVFAGLIPKLKRSGLFGPGLWCIRIFRPETSPLTNLQKALGGDVTALEIRVQQLLSTQPDARRLLLVVDQFEELFTQRGEEAKPFQEALLKLMEIPNVYLILTVRADFYADLMVSLLWDKIRSHRVEVLPLNKKGLRQAIVRPAAGVNVYIDSALVERLLVDATGAGEIGILPLVQETLVRLWEKLERRFLPLKAYELLALPGSADGEQPQTGLQVAIALQADTAFASLETEEKQAIARRIFLRLIQFGQGRPDTRRQQKQRNLYSVDDDLELSIKTIEHLAQRRILTFSGEDNIKEKADRKIDLAHEALISAWPMLRQWIKDHRKAEEDHRRLEIKADEWVRLGQGNGGLLDSFELAEAEGWLSTPDAKELGYTLSLTYLVTASKKAIEESERSEKEHQDREEALITEKIKEQERSRIAKELRNRVIVGSASIVIVIGIIAWSKGQDIENHNMLFSKAPVANPKLIPKLPQFLKEAQDLSKQGEKEADTAIDYYRNILTKSKKLQKDSRVSSPEQITIKETINQAEPALVNLIDSVRIPILQKQLQERKFGKHIAGKVQQDLDERFTDALKTTYKILLLDTDADVDRNGNLDSQDEVDSIPCKILLKIEKDWRTKTHGHCGFYEENSPYSPSPSCKELDGNTLAIKLIAIESQALIVKRFEYCKKSES